MTCDTELLRALAAADAHTPPPAGTAPTPASLRAAATRRRFRRFAAVAALTTLVGILALARPRPLAGGDDEHGDTLRRELNHLCASLDALQTQLHRLTPTTSTDDAERRTADRLRYELADARACALTTQHDQPSKENR